MQLVFYLFFLFPQQGPGRAVSDGDTQKLLPLTAMEQHSRVKFTCSSYYSEADVHLRPNESDLFSQPPRIPTSPFIWYYPRAQDLNRCWALCCFTATRVWLNLLVWLKSLFTTEHPVINTILLQIPRHGALSLYQGPTPQLSSDKNTDGYAVDSSTDPWIRWW